MRGIVWFKKDLRVTDNPALYHAAQLCTDGIVAVYVIDREMWAKNNVAHGQIEFILRGLQILQTQLEQLHIPLIVKEVNKTAQIQNFFLTLANEIKAEHLFFNREYEVNESRRDAAVEDYLMRCNIKGHVYDDQLILSANAVRSKQGDYFKVFTPFKRSWLNALSLHGDLKLWPKPKVHACITIPATAVPKKLPGIHSTIAPELWPAGELIARKKLRAFTIQHLQQYDHERDFPDLDATSHLSPYLAVGMISAKECFLAALTANAFELDSGNKGALTWMSELIWREFYRHILIAVPRVCMNKAYKLATENLPWRYDERLLVAWQQGKTGFPIVDAAMRQLNTTGWMHNRLRMIAAMFLSKNLFLDWRLGEKYFAEHLIDNDFASNNGGWQWSASTGTDAVPYFRIFNPTTQSERFDPEGKFIKQFCPELRDFDAKLIHAPSIKAPLLVAQSGYPEPIVDYRKSRDRVLKAFQHLAG